ncbi:MAG: GDSL-type esterase/lipase family protein [Rikenellaceae bacterium]
MKKILFLVVCALGFICAQDAPMRVACIGDSVTMGYGLANAKEDAYPSQLGRLLGENYLIKTFGELGTTVVTEDYSHICHSPEFPRMLEFAPDVITICLGSYDSKDRYRSTAKFFERDYIALIENIKEVLPDAKIIVMSPPKYHLKGEDDYLATNIIPILKKVAGQYNLQFVDVYPIFENDDKELLSYGVHPTAKGAGLIARELVKYF